MIVSTTFDPTTEEENNHTHHLHTLSHTHTHTKDCQHREERPGRMRKFYPVNVY